MIDRRLSFTCQPPPCASEQAIRTVGAQTNFPLSWDYSMPQKRHPKSETRRKTDKIFVRVTPDEKLQLRALAATCGMTVPELLRVSALRNKPLTIIDKGPIRDLLKVSADLGRLGGLLKLWLSQDTPSTPGRAVKRFEIRALLEDIRTTNELLKRKITSDN